MRAVAVLLVVAFHARVTGISGGFVGVDVFFVISGFLITGLLADEQRRTGTLSLTGFYARRVRRLLPLGTLVLVATVVASRLVLPAVEQPAVAGESTAAALWFANWHYAAAATSYMSSVDLSPVLHFWSLSVEEQFYVVWPLLVLLVTAGRGTTSWQTRRTRLLVALLGLGAASFALSAATTRGSGPWAYFGLHTRAWELATGGLVALALPLLARVPRRAAAAAGWVGLAMVVAAAVAFSSTTLFPGTAAALPVAGAALLLAAGARTDAGASRLLAVPVLTFVGRVSYGWYLWHWPCLVLARAVWGNPTADSDLGSSPEPGPWVIGGAVAVSFLLAVVSHWLVEQPARTSRRLAASRGLTFAVAAALLVTSVGSAQLLLNPRAEVPSGGAQTPGQARNDTGTSPPCFAGFPGTKADGRCRFGDKRGTHVVVLVGDSHAAHWFPAMEKVALERHWQLWFWAKSACVVAAVREYTPIYHREYSECTTWRANVMHRIAELPRVDAVVIGRAYAYSELVLDDRGKHPKGAAAEARVWRDGSRKAFVELSRLARHVVILRDTPWPGLSVPGCLSKHPGEPQSCSYRRAGHTELDTDLVHDELAAVPPGTSIRFVDMNDAVCPRSRPLCPVVTTAGSIVFRDRHHLTARFAREISAVLGARLDRYVED
jgi:peptidoglycan/LPS O-acetylase OafA/YrhL